MKTIIYLLLVFLLLTGLKQTAYTQNLQADSLALVVLYDSTQGASWTIPWDLNQPVNTWNGVTVSNTRVTTINLNANGLVGELPDVNLTALTKLYLANNALNGVIPDFNGLADLEELDLQGNQLTGNIPNFSALHILKKLSLQNNQLSGSLPNFNNLFLLEYLEVSNNQLGGSPPSLNFLPNLKEFYLNNNQLTGTLPNFSGATALAILHLENNQLTAGIPNFSSLPALEQLWLDNNQLFGVIPNFTNLPNLTHFSVNNNSFTGTLPFFNNCPALDSLHISENSFTFEDLLPVQISLFNRNIYWEYQPQFRIGRTRTRTLPVGGTYTIDLEVDDTVSTSTYYWYKDGVLIDSVVGNNEYTIANFQPADTGVYTARVVNSIMTKYNVNHQTLILTSYATTLRLGIGIQQLPTYELEVYPNPTQASIYLQMPSIQGSYQVQVVDVQGKIVHNLQSNATHLLEVSLQEQPAGVYFVRLSNGEKIWQNKVIKY